MSPGLIGPVVWVTLEPELPVSNVTSWEVWLWFVTSTVIGPAPNEAGDAETRLAEI